MPSKVVYNTKQQQPMQMKMVMQSQETRCTLCGVKFPKSIIDMHMRMRHKDELDEMNKNNKQKSNYINNKSNIVDIVDIDDHQRKNAIMINSRKRRKPMPGLIGMFQ
jgi:hypothetical protein